MMEFNFYAPLRIIFKENEINNIAAYTARNGNRVFLVVGKSHLKETGKLNEILEKFKRNSKIEEVIVFDKTPQNPDVEAIEEAKNEIIANRLNVVVAVGGGSAMDLAKIASICAKQEKGVWQLKEDPALNVLDAYPIICSPTTSGSGSEVTRYAVFNDNRKRVKVAFSSLSIYPTVSLIDPTLTYTMPQSVIANTGFDALSHAIEAYTSRSACPITDVYCREAISLIGVNLPKAYNSKDKNAMNNMSLAAMFAGMALNVGRASLPHALEHSLSAFNPELPHGLGLSMVMVPFLKRAVEHNKEKFADIAYLLGEDISNMGIDDAAKRCIDAVIEIKERIGLNKSLKDFGFDKKTIDELVDTTFWTMDHGIKNSPCEFSKEDIKQIYYEALEG
ncbi:iron-containing alcohol dehydrogenase [Hippea maritima]|uniref:Alcohol dehydrogenase n=1 Tax=Hippea maritima (strain ATCC 700847 / DSM 10411 / MH2) TaxID=760142 RepID=F2LVH8_HIPMA|nr:iron-containing alcohol dehydrogenase [Hippea maritima]AEA33762.1 Alcohol dehydrogenase [Hippea maritima DSM 10411]